jgi:hypothetical protein
MSSSLNVPRRPVDRMLDKPVTILATGPRWHLRPATVVFKVA